MNKYLKGSLSLIQAGTRFQLIDTSNEISYQLFLKINKGDSYEGEVRVNFHLLKVSPELFFDYAGTTIKQITINGAKVETNNDYENLRDMRFLKVPEANLKTGPNEIIITFANTYANDGLGLHSFVDTDGKQYVYSQLEAYAANKVFPCFDQPDLKATLALTMAVPTEWVAISNEPISTEATNIFDVNKYLTEDEQKTHKVATFQTTPKLSTYLYAFIAGPYLEIKSVKIHKNIQMSCYSRESLFPYLMEQADEIFEITRECLKFFEEFFNFPYPFTKYDSIFCPEYKFGAMENAGAVTFNDLYIWREKVTIDRNTVRAATITHEASHHWFGNLVTMKWWNDLWLNESFAVYISYFCLTRIEKYLTTTKFCDVWLRFFGRKCTGYNADEKITTHPIAGDVTNTEEAETIFDGITYSKGASALKQLVCLIGEENFSKAISAYFSRFAWTNATIEDFTSCLQEFYAPSFPGCPEDLKAWRNEWIEKAGLNECIPIFNPNDNVHGAILTIKQQPVLEEFPTLRHHKMKIAFFNDNGDIYEVRDIMMSNKEQNIVTYDGTVKPKAILLNYQDEAFIKVHLDEYSLAFFKAKLGSVKEELTRGLIWRSIFDMVKDGKISGYSFTQIAEGAIETETSDSILESIFTFITSYLFELSPSVLRNNLVKPKLFAKTLKRLVETEKTNANRTVLLRNHLIQFASLGEQLNVDNVAKLVQWLDGTDTDLKDVELTIAKKWSIVKILHRYPRLSNSSKLEYFNKVGELDKSDRRNLAAKYCETIRSNLEEKNKLWGTFLDPNSKPSIQMFQQELLGYSHSIRDQEEHARLFFENIESVFQNLSGEFASNFYEILFPDNEKLDYYLVKVKELLQRVKEHNKLHKLLKNSLDDLEKKRKAYACSAPDVLREFFDISI